MGCWMVHVIIVGPEFVNGSVRDLFPMNSSAPACSIRPLLSVDPTISVGNSCLGYSRIIFTLLYVEYHVSLNPERRQFLSRLVAKRVRAFASIP